MVAERLPMRKVLEVLRLKFECKKGERPIAKSVGIGRTTVSEYLARFASSGLSWPLPPDMDEQQLEAKLFPPKNPTASKVMPDFAHVATELLRPDVTLALLWSEYHQEHPEDGYQLSYFCELYGDWARKNRLWMRAR